ncbi:hypothetical protein KZO83_07495 [Chromohalobacter sp. TMW 2.2308]|uniref:hypothetical protein n=1 Tax=Chromohalobacter TaxID=42054 RepID=UPI001FFDA5AC|nr:MULTISPECIES: hypothetical protein [Chromohalobacter]MCK2042531.1 hypothetical protein [Chromohalobacter moromii]MCT8514950.1 hypothetical protein [Chromohalobacter sp. TMW 2.2271]
MKTPLTTAQRSLISLIVDTAIDVSLHGTHKAVADYRGDVHTVFVSTCLADEWFSTNESQSLVAFLARYADEDEVAHRERVNNELAALYDHLKSLLPESQS